MIVYYTATAIHRRSIGAITRLQKHYVDTGLKKAVFIGWQHHIVDKIVKHVLNDHLVESTISLTRSYSFIITISQDEQVEIVFENAGKLLMVEQVRERGGMAFLYYLISN